jgi:hypothetical protein
LIDLDADLEAMDRDALISVARVMRREIRAHRDSSGNELCWHHPVLWDLLPDRKPLNLTVPDWPHFLRGCIHYRASLDRQLLDAPRTDEEYRP